MKYYVKNNESKKFLKVVAPDVYDFVSSKRRATQFDTYKDAKHYVWLLKDRAFYKYIEVVSRNDYRR